MTKSELLKEYEGLLEMLGMSWLGGIYANSRKEEIQHAIDCLKCTDETLEDYLVIVKHKYSNIYNQIIKSDFRHHSHNRLYVYDIARRVLGIA